MKNLKQRMQALALASVAAVAVQTAQADLVSRSLCIFDPIGASGPLFNVMKPVKPASLQWGVDLKLQAYTDEKIAAEDFKAGQCDGVLLTGTRAREFNKFTGTLEAIGAIPGDTELKMVMDTLTQPQAASLMKSGNYEVVGILPAGAIYLFTRDRSIDTVEKLQGKKIATLDYDNASLTMVRRVGASVVGSSTANFAGKFNNGSVDIAYAPAVAYTPLELYKGVEPKGGVFNYKLAQMNFQIIVHADRFPEGFGQKAREYAATRYEEAYELVRQAEAEIKPEYWMHPKPEDVAGYDKLLREVRLQLRDEGTYDARALTVMRKVRCRVNPSNAECAEALE